MWVFSTAKNITREDMNKIARNLENNYPEGSDLVMTIADILRKEGLEEGKRAGKRKEKKKG